MPIASLLLLTLCANMTLLGGAWLVVAWRLRFARSPALHWMGFSALVGFGAAVIGLVEAPLAAALTANVAIAVAVAVMTRGLLIFLGEPPDDPTTIASVMGVVLCAVLAGATTGPARAGIVAVAMADAVVFGGMVLRTAAALRREFGVFAAMCVTVPPAATALMCAVRAAKALLGEEPAARPVLTQFDPSMSVVALNLLSTLFIAFNLALGGLVVVRIVRRLDRLSHSDVLTGLPNRRWLMQRMQALRLRQRRSGSGFAVLLLDLDFFKRVNDVHGHAAGDAALRKAAKVFAQALGQSEETPLGPLGSEPLLARLGGEEFCVLMPGCDLPQACAAAESLRRALRETRVAVGGGVTLDLTTSIGVALARGDDAAYDSALRRADVALYAAKESGRDRVVVDSDSGVAPIGDAAPPPQRRSSDAPKQVRQSRRAGAEVASPAPTTEPAESALMGGVSIH